jgi:AAA domain/RepB DNA-primase N-terminal domain
MLGYCPLNGLGAEGRKELRCEDWECEDFLELIWGERDCWVDMPSKVGAYWIPFYLKWPEGAANLTTQRIDSSLRDKEDLYYSVAQFSARGRRIEDALSSAWLWADLDEVHPTEGTRLGLLPTVAVESSPGRYQALWRLERRLKPNDLARVNRGLSYALEADRGGWDLTQVLRIVGTRNYKYPGAPVVRALWYHEDLVYDPRRVWDVVKDAVPASELRGAMSPDLPRRQIKGRARELLRASVSSVVQGERSARLWELNCLLGEAGLGEDEIYDLVVGCAWNKWAGEGETGRNRLMRDIRRALVHIRREAARVRDGARDEAQEVHAQTRDAAPVTSTGLPWIGYSSFMSMTMGEPKWLVEDIWTAGSHGIIGGEPKTSKTTIALGLALAVASGSPFLGRWQVGVSGPVLMVQEENAPWMMQDRMRKLAALMGLISTVPVHIRQTGAGALGSVSVDLEFPVDLPLKLLNNYGFDLGVEEHREMLEAEVSELSPKLLILDPLYLILPADYNQADSLRPFLKWILELRYKYDMAVAIVHHMAKKREGVGVVRSGQRILGSTILHGFSDSAVFVSLNEGATGGRDGWIGVDLETEFRSMAPRRGVTLGLSMGPPGGLMMELEVGLPGLEARMLEIVTLTPGVAVTKLVELLGIDRRTVISRVRGSGGVFRLEEGGGRGHPTKVWLGSEGSGERGNNGKATAD